LDHTGSHHIYLVCVVGITWEQSEEKERKNVEKLKEEEKKPNCNW